MFNDISVHRIIRYTFDILEKIICRLVITPVMAHPKCKLDTASKNYD